MPRLPPRWSERERGSSAGAGAGAGAAYVGRRPLAAVRVGVAHAAGPVNERRTSGAPSGTVAAGGPAGGDGGGDAATAAPSAAGSGPVGESGGGPSGGGGVADPHERGVIGGTAIAPAARSSCVSERGSWPRSACTNSSRIERETAWRAVESGVWRLDSGARVYSSSSSLLTIFATPSSVA